MTFIIFLIILFLSPYLIMHRKRFKESRNKKQYLQTNFLSSNIWIILLIAVCTVFTNMAFDEGESNDEGNLLEEPTIVEEEPTVDDLDSLNFNRYSHIEIPDFQNFYIKTHLRVEKNHLALFDYYDSLATLGYVNISNWGKGLTLVELALYDSALTYLDKIQDLEQRYYFYTWGRAYEGLEQDSLASIYYMKEVLSEDGSLEYSTRWLTQYYMQHEDYGKLAELLTIEGTETYFNYSLRKKTQFLDANIVGYYGTIFSTIFSRINPTGVLAAFLIMLVWFRFVTRLAFFQKLRLVELVSCLVLGMAFTFLTFLLSDGLEYSSGDSNFWNTFTWSVIGIGAIEELVKIIPLLILMLTIKRQMDAYEYILFASISALGFGFSENLLYFDGEYGSIITGRALTAAVGHMIDSSIFAYGFVLAKFKYKNLNPILAFFIFWGLAALVHGLYDYWIFAELYLFFIFFFLLIIRVWNTVLNNSINNSLNFTYNSSFNTRRLQFYLVISLTGIIMFEYLVTAAQFGKVEANDFLIGAFFSGGFLIAFLGSKLSSLNLIKNYWGKINYSINPFTDDIVSQNFVGQKVFLSTYYADEGLIAYFPEGVVGRITSRVILQNRPPTFFMSNDDSSWFLVKLAHEIIEPGFRKDKVLIQFKDHYSSLNDQKKFIVKLLLIPDKIRKVAGNPLRKDFESLGWVFLEGKS